MRLSRDSLDSLQKRPSLYSCRDAPSVLYLIYFLYLILYVIHFEISCIQIVMFLSLSLSLSLSLLLVVLRDNPLSSFP